jgi:hypothetical protein
LGQTEEFLKQKRTQIIFKKNLHKNNANIDEVGATKRDRQTGEVFFQTKNPF